MREGNFEGKWRTGARNLESEYIRRGKPHLEERGLCGVVKRGPLVYCLESMDIEGGHKIDNVLIPADIRLTPKKITIEGSPIVALDGTARLVDEVSWKDTLYREVGKADKPVHIRLIPYYAWGNRGKAEMTVWMPLARTNH